MFVKTPRLPHDEIIRLYVAGESRGMIALRAKVSDSHIRHILVSAGIRIRPPNESIRLAKQQQKKRLAAIAARSGAV